MKKLKYLTDPKKKQEEEPIKVLDRKMNENNRKMIWDLIQKRGDELKLKLKPHPNHPKGRNAYAHICSIINKKFGCSYKDVKDDQIDFLKNFIMDIND